MGVIENFSLVINFNKLGLYQYAAIIKFKFLSRDETTHVDRFVHGLPEVSRAIKSLNSEEYFMNLILEDEDEVEKFEKKVRDEFKDKIASLNMFKID